MAIPKVIYQTYKSARLPLLAQWHSARFKRRNPDYAYEFYDDERLHAFFFEEFGSRLAALSIRIRIGAAKADLFRYAVLLKYGGIYLDIDSTIKSTLNSFILADDAAIISYEGNPGLYVQWALIYEANHPFLVRTLEKVIENLEANRYPYDVHQMTGPTVYSAAIKECLQYHSTIPYRLLGVDYNGHLLFKYPLSSLFRNKKEHWKNVQQHQTVLYDAAEM